MGNERYTTKEVIKAIQKTFGIKTAIAEALGCTRQTVDNYIKRHPTVADAYWAERERLVDMAEAKFAESIKGGEWAAISFCLRTLGKERGFVERRQIEEMGDKTIRLEWADGEDKDTEPASSPGTTEDSPSSGAAQGHSGGQAVRED